jgi:hypothetical protein
MNEQSTAAVATVSSVPDTALERADRSVRGPNDALAVLPDIGSPEAFQARIERDERMRHILRDYVKRNMHEGHHFYTELGSTKLEKPALKGDGAHQIASLFKLIFGQPHQEEKYFDDGHYQCKTTIDIFNAEGFRIATGLGICTTRESKYRWRKESRTCPDCGAAAIFKDNKSPQGGWYCWMKRDGCGAKFQADDPAIEEQKIGRVENTDLADSYNTVAKMSLKRAKVGGICQVPLVSELFVPDDADDDEDLPAKTQSREVKPQPLNQKNAAKAPSVPQSIAKAVDLANKLVLNHGVEPEDLARQFLPENVESFDKLNELQAAAVVPSLVELLNAKVNGK